MPLLLSLLNYLSILIRKLFLLFAASACFCCTGSTVGKVADGRLTEGWQLKFMINGRCVTSDIVIGNESVRKIIINDTIISFLNCNQHFANFEPLQFPSVV